MPARLTVYPPDQPARQFQLEPEREYLVGRGPDCDLRIEDPRLSRRHARLAVADGRWHFDDLGSKNGTLLAGRASGEATLRDGDWISFGGLLGQYSEPNAQRLAAEEREARLLWSETVRRSRGLDPQGEVETLLQQMLRASMELAGAQRGYVMLADAAGLLKLRASAGVEPVAAGREFPGSRRALMRALAEAAPVVICDTSADTLLGAQPSVIAGKIRALVCLPLKVGDQLIGVLYLDSNHPGKVFTQLDVEILEAFAAHAALVIGVATVREDLADVAGLLPREITREPTPEPLLRKLLSRLPGLVARDGGSPPP